ncbi:MAG: chemotaxis protein CheA [Proteobacteria bacterium]|nr:chemotaxis protein CheA [Pseudomonadota bacterium]
MTETLEIINKKIETLALETVILDSEDIPGLGKTVQSIETIMELSNELKEQSMISVCEAMKEYIEAVILREKIDLGPFEKGISSMQKIVGNLSKGISYEGDIAELIAGLGCQVEDGCKSDNESESGEDKKDSNSTASLAPIKINDEDKEIISDFIVESLDNLASIEISLMDLEQDPTDVETINAIFRPFHTVKGVSGFLNFNKINQFAHKVENLLDKARNGELTINADIIDVILESVDLLKGMIENVRSSLDTGIIFEGSEDTKAFEQRIEGLLSPTTKDKKKLLGEMLVSSGSLTTADIQDALEIQQKSPDKKLGEILVEHEKVKTKVVVSSLREQKRADAPESLQVKVDTVKLDNIVDMVGELAIAQSMLKQHEAILDNKDRKLLQITNQLNLITSSLQDTAMSMRMVPIKTTFQKMLRLVRDLARKAGKDIQLVMSGEETEIDRNLIEEIYEPMVHMIRNSVDHGLEVAKERLENNKTGQGTIFLKAYHKGGNIVIEIGDDGRGLNREKIISKALQSGLLKEGEKLTDLEIDNLIFHPGFSTADKITEISGRGVGTDVVKSKVEKLRGRVEVRSNSGKGATFFIRLPLTLAIVDGMIVRVANERFIIPTLNIQESFRPQKEEFFTVRGEEEIIKVRNNLIPLVRLDRLLGLKTKSASEETEMQPWEKLVVVVENQEKKKCLLVDELIGREEVVIKSMGGWLKDIKGIAGSVIMGDGRVGLILDIGSIFQMVSRES